MAIGEIGAKSFSGSNFAVGSVIGLMTWVVVVPIARVYPSFGWPLTYSAPTTPAPPGRFSTSTCLPQKSLSFCATVRARMSLAPPGA